MGIISILPEHVANQIAAGEVVDGPSSIIKELVENSIDAKANKIFIDVSKNFLRINIIDNGIGIDANDLELAFKKHATSKIKNIDDLFTIHSNGFRGEALPSIASVSKVTCVSKTKEAEFATKIYLENGKQEISQTGAFNGTNITVDDLFFNTPARLKFLKSNKKERTSIVDTVRSLALANLAVEFSLSIDAKEVLKTSASGNLKQTVSEIFSASIAESLIPVNKEIGEIKVTGYSSNTYVSRSDKRAIFTFVNGRSVSSYIMRSAIESVYKELLPVTKHPIAVISLEIPNDQIDINVHPNKKEIKFENTNAIYNLIGDAISKAISDSFYESSQSFQQSLKDNEIQTQFKNDVQKLNSDLLARTKHYSKASDEHVMPKQSSFSDIKEEAAIEMLNSHFNSPVAESVRDFDKIDSFNDTRKFISRFGALDIVLVDSNTPKTVISSLGNKTNFDIVAKSDEVQKAVILKGDFVGENWIKENYFSFLHEMAEKILEREILNINFNQASTKKTNLSRPQQKPSKSLLETIWQRDNYTCVYCKKALLNPALIKEKLKECSDPDKLHEHLASYDHHLPASKNPALNKDERNLYACCQSCNIKKSDSLASKTWTPLPSDAWQSTQLIAGIEFTSGYL